tara:strand:- start:839 stop:1060 length:222 start_codon:yes stop_codon:yes gene_type:complete
MSVKLTIHSIDTNSNTAVISLKDGDSYLISEQSLEIKMNPDGSANNEWLKTFSKYFSVHKRLVWLDKIEDDLL